MRIYAVIRTTQARGEGSIISFKDFKTPSLLGGHYYAGLERGRRNGVEFHRRLSFRNLHTFRPTSFFSRLSKRFGCNRIEGGDSLKTLHYRDIVSG